MSFHVALFTMLTLCLLTTASPAALAAPGGLTVFARQLPSSIPTPSALLPNTSSHQSRDEGLLGALLGPLIGYWDPGQNHDSNNHKPSHSYSSAHEHAHVHGNNNMPSNSHSSSEHDHVHEHVHQHENDHNGHQHQHNQDRRMIPRHPHAPGYEQPK